MFGTCQCSPFVTRPNCSLTRNHSSIDQPWPPCSTGPAHHAGARRSPRGGSRRRSPPAAVRGVPRPRARAGSAPSTNSAARWRSSSCSAVSSPGAVGVGSRWRSWISFARWKSQAASRRRSAAVRPAARPDNASSRLWWFEITALARARARATSGSSVCGRRCVDQLDDAVQICEPLPRAPVQHEPLDPLALASDRVGRRNAAAGERRDCLRELALGLGRDRQPGRALDHGRYTNSN